MKAQTLPVSELQRNKRVKELMEMKKQSPPKQPKEKTHLTPMEMDQVRSLMSSGMSRQEAVNTVIEAGELLGEYIKKKEVTLNQADYSKGGFVNDEKYKQPIKHKLY
jgi:hypothetical protein